MSLPSHDISTDSPSNPPKVLLPGEGRSVAIGSGARCTFKVLGKDTHGHFGLFEYEKFDLPFCYIENLLHLLVNMRFGSSSSWLHLILE